MEELIDLIATDAAASDVRDKINDLLYAKAAQKIENVRPVVASSLFDQSGNEESQDQE